MFVSLNNEISIFIEEEAKRYIAKYKLHIPIGTNILQQLEKESILLLYPLYDENANGICVTRTVKDEQKHFVYINTSNYMPKQVYTAAHEIGHIISIDKKIKKQYIEYRDDPEVLVNRFASALLMPKKEFSDKFKECKKDTIGTKTTANYLEINSLIYELMLFFVVPYRAICYRLGELSFISSADVNNLEQYERTHKSEILRELKNKGNKYEDLIKADYKKSFSNLIELVDNAELNSLTFKTKINQIRELFKDDIQQSKDITIQQI